MASVYKISKWRRQDSNLHSVIFSHRAYRFAHISRPQPVLPRHHLAYKASAFLLSAIRPKAQARVARASHLYERCILLLNYKAKVSAGPAPATSILPRSRSAIGATRPDRPGTDRTCIGGSSDRCPAVERRACISAPGLEPGPRVLQTRMLPLHHADLRCRNRTCLSESTARGTSPIPSGAEADRKTADGGNPTGADHAAAGCRSVNVMVV